jgi:hypothetical protein
MSTTEETKIDWSKPVQTKETPPRKVRILTTEAAGDYPIVGNIEGDNMYRTWRIDGSRYHSMACECDIEPAPTWKLPDPPANQQWHRNDWTEEMLSAGYRPLLRGEPMADGDEYGSDYQLPEGSPPKKWKSFPGMRQTSGHMRTTRPIRQQPEKWAAEKAAFAAGETIQHKPILHPDVAWKNTSVPIWADDSIYRIKPKPQKVKLEPCDVPPGSVIRSDLDHWFMVLMVRHNGVMIHTRMDVLEWDYLQRHWEIKRPTDTEWQPCYKEVLP